MHRVSSSPASIKLLARLSQTWLQMLQMRLFVQRTKLSNTHLLRGLSNFLHCHSCWLLLSRHSQCLRNSAKQCLFTSSSLLSQSETHPPRIKVPAAILACSPSSLRVYVHAGCASCDLATLPQAVQLSPTVRLGLALHVVIVVRLAAGSNEEACAHKRRGRSSNFLDLGNRVRERSGVHEDLLVEPGRKWLVDVPVVYRIELQHTWVVWRPF